MQGVATSAANSWPPMPYWAGRSSFGHRARQAAKITPVDDGADLVARCRNGDEAAFRKLFQTHRDDVARLVFRMTGASSELEDLIQEVFLQVHKSIADFRGDARFSTWLYRLTVNVVLMHRRSAKSRPLLVAEVLAAAPKDSRLLPDEQVARRRRMIAFTRLVDRLSEKKRTVFILHELEGLAPSEIAKIVGAPVLTVRTRLFYARRELTQMLREEPALAGLVPEGDGKLDVVTQVARGEST
jgi:RNA polymerase sigma-70 factor (ECF subfamily)